MKKNKMKQTPPKRNTFRLLRNMAVFFFIVVASCLGGLQTPWAKNILANVAESQLGALTGWEFKAGALQGVIPWNMRLDTLEIRDKNGKCVQVNDVAVRLEVMSLLSGQILLREVTIESIEILRLPQSDNPSEYKGLAMPSLPNLPRWFSLDSLVISRILIEQSVVGKEAEFTAVAHYKPSGTLEDWELYLNAEGVGETPGNITLSLGLKNNIPLIVFDVKDESILPQLLQMQSPVQLVLDGQMQDAMWNGVFSGNAGGESFGEMELLIKPGPIPSLEANGTLHLATTMFMDEYTKWCGEDIDFAIKAILTENKTIQIENFSPYFNQGILQDAGIDLNANAVLTPNDDVSTINVDVMFSDLVPLGNSLGQNISGAVAGTLHFEVQGDSVKMKMDLSPEEFQHGAVRFKDTNLQAEFASSAGLQWPPFPFSWDIQGDGMAVYADWGDARKVTLQTQGEMENWTVFDIAALSLNDGNTDLALKGNLDIDTMFGDLNGHIKIEEIGLWAGLFAYPLKGRAETKLTIYAQEDDEGLAIELEGSLSKISGVYDEYLSVFGDKCDFVANAVLNTAHLQLSNLHLNADPILANATGKYIFKNRQIQLKTNIKSETLEPLATLLSREMAGKLNADISLDGTWDAMTLDTILELSSLSMPPVLDSNAILALHLEGLPKTPQGTISARLNDAVYGFDANAQLAMEKDMITIKPLTLNSGANTIQGEVSLSPGLGTIQSAFQADCPELETLGAMLGMELAGKAKFSGQLSLQDKQINTKGEAYASTFKTPWFSVSQLDSNWELLGETTKPQGTITLDAINLQAMGLDLSSLKLITNASGETIAINASGEGVFQKKYPVGFDAASTLNLTEQILTLKSLSLNLDSLNAQLLEQTTIQFADNTLFELSPFNLKLDEGNLQGEGKWSADKVSANFNLESLPLKILEPFGAPALEGFLDSSFILTGSPENPVFQSDFNLKNVRSQRATTQNLPDLDMQGTLYFKDEVLQVEAHGNAPEFLTLEGQSRLPLQFSLTPYNLTFPPSQTLAGSFSSFIKLDFITYLLGNETHALRGDLNLNAQLQGTWDTPAFAGEIHTTNAQYDNATTGTYFEKLDIQAELNQHTLKLTRFEATDAKQGVLQGSGVLQFDATQSYPYEFAFNMKDSQLVYRDNYKARLNGDASIVGNMGQCLLKGELVLAPALITLDTETSAKQYTPVEYREINGDFTPDNEGETIDPPILINLDIHCVIPGQLYVRMPVLDSEWQGDITIKGNLNKPEVSGYIKAISGQLDFLGKRFKLRDSIINMNQEDVYTPYLNVTAMTEANDVEAGVKVQGPADAFELAFVSVPPLPEDDVLAYILFGRSSQEMNPVQAIELARYAAILGGKYSGLGIFGHTSTLPGLDALTLKTGEALQDTQIGFGTYITDKFYVELLQGGIGTNASVEYRITPSIKFKGATSSENDNSIGIFWKRDY